MPSSIAVEKRTATTGTARYLALRDYALAHKLKMNKEDFNHSLDDFKRVVAGLISTDDFTAALTGDTEDAIREQAEMFMRQALPWYDYGDSKVLSPLTLPTELFYALTRALAALTRTETSPSTNSPTKSSEPASSGQPDDVVGITGDTRHWKDQIKSAAVRAGGGRYKWDGKALAWNVYRSTWDDLIASYPQAAQQLQLTTATRTL
ncbi:hypothetical protein HZU77_016415 [Neisseriaceae bacterium TC5R-5]|nr:hypothetical protein [Neisseriaceae bacterium TC5R-5]